MTFKELHERYRESAQSIAQRKLDDPELTASEVRWHPEAPDVEARGRCPAKRARPGKIMRSCTGPRSSQKTIGSKTCSKHWDPPISPAMVDRMNRPH